MQIPTDYKIIECNDHSNERDLRMLKILRMKTKMFFLIGSFAILWSACKVEKKVVFSEALDVDIAIDTKEIKKVCLVDREEFHDFAKIMLSLDVGGLHYREYLHREAFKILDSLEN